MIIVMVAIFSVKYSKTIKRLGFLYRDTILVQSEENGNTIYSGKIKGKNAKFTVYKDKTVDFEYGDKIYGRYKLKQDNTAVPERFDGDDAVKDDMVGIELTKGDEVIFRGGMVEYDAFRFLYNEDGSGMISEEYFFYSDSETILDENGNIIDIVEPSIHEVIELMREPIMTHKGDKAAFFYGLFICIATAISVLFADEIFRYNMSFRIKDAEDIEPSDWEIASRYFAWMILPFIALLIFVIGLE